MRHKIPQLDAVRGVAILVVMIHNISAKYPFFHSDLVFKDGWMGVDLFFVLSGFLITGILVDTRETPGYFKNFYARRCLRIWPLYYALLLFMFVAIRFLNPSEYHTVLQTSSPWWAYVIYLQNFIGPISTQAAGPLGVTWSLAIEEQFYLFWAIVVRFCSVTLLRRVALIELCVSPALRYYLSLHNVNLYTNIFCRLDGLMAGAALVLLVSQKDFVPSKWVRHAWICLLFAAPLALLADHFRLEWIVFSFSALASAAFIYVSLFSPHRPIRAVMTNRFLIYTGVISYGLYLLHKIPIGFVQTLHLDRGPFSPLPIIIALSYLIATLSWNFYEKPFLRLKRFFESPPSGTDKAGSLKLAVSPRG